MTSINSIKSILNVSRGPSLRANYIINIVPPLGIVTQRKNPATAAAVGVIALAGMKQLSMLAKDSEIPGRKITTTPHRMYGTVRQMPYGILYDPIDITFICTNIMIERAFFDIWQQYIVAPKSNYLNYYKDYVGTIIIQKIDNAGFEAGSLAGEVISIFTLEEAYPISVQAQKLSADSKNEILTLTVTFSYARWRSSLDYTLNLIDPLFDAASSGAIAATNALPEALKKTLI